MPPTRSPSTSSARLHAAPRAQRTQPCATIGASASGFRGASDSRTSPRRVAFRATCTAASRSADCPRRPANSRQQRSHWRSPKVRVTPRRRPCRATDLAGRAQLLVPVAREELERTAATGLSHDESRAISLAWITIGGIRNQGGVANGPILKKPCISDNSSGELESPRRQENAAIGVVPPLS